jgi:uncharacterized pyridoxamine 5'-phosphate oxidase family protein
MDRDIQQYIDKAVEEILNPAFTVTRQYLEVNEIENENGKPKIERVDLNYAENLAVVYFLIKSQRYYLQINLVKTPEIKVVFSHIESGNKIYLTATSEKHSFQELSQNLTLKPLIGWTKGDYRKNGKSQYNFSRISYEPFISEAYELERQIKLLLTELENHSESIIELTKKATTYIGVCKQQYVSGNAGIHFDIETINRIAKLNLRIDIDTYIGGIEINIGE